MANKFYPIKIKSVEKTTVDCAVVELDVPQHQTKDFAFKQGQYLTLKAIINGEDIRRSYSLCTSPLEGSWKVAIKKIDGGRFSTFANEQLKAGDMLEVLPPTGHFFVESEHTQAKNYIAFAAGSGITPILSIIKTHLQLEPESTFKLFYINQAVSTIILREELEALKNKFLHRFEIFHFLTREARHAPLFNGRIDRAKLDILFRTLIDAEQADDFFICGPNQMIFLIRDYLQAQGFDESQIHFELFNTSTGEADKTKRVQRKIDPSLLSEISIQEGGKTFKFNIPRASDNILDAALKKQADLPYACKGGVCSTCRAKLLEGEVDMEFTYGLEAEEIEQGYVLTCQAIPLTEKVTVDFEA
ncbi:MAG: 1,2-phenylacetyl-CoA epoxidase subunit PaaE [Bacteroidota bacterium]